MLLLEGAPNDLMSLYDNRNFINIAVPESRPLNRDKAWIALLAIFLVYLVMAAQFESFVYPLIIMFTVPLALAGALGGLWLFDQSINVYSQIGVILLMGIVAKNAILVTEFANQLQHQGLAKLEAIRTAAHVRLRPILMTTLATVVGHFPLVLVSGAGAEARNSIGIILVAGMLIGSLFTLFILPCLYLVLGDNLQAHADAEPSPPLTPAEAR